jgi:anthranilate synthase component I
MTINTTVRKHLADTFTPVSIYLKIRDKYSETVLLESTDFRSKENCFSFIGIDPIAKFILQNDQLELRLPDGTVQKETITDKLSIPKRLHSFIHQFETNTPEGSFNGFLGHTSYDAVQYFESIELDLTKRKTDLPDIHYSLYRFIIAINHFKDELTILENTPEGQESQVNRLETVINTQSFATYRFNRVGEERSNLTDNEFKNQVRIGKHHCHIGDVFQLVLSRRFTQDFKGDDFNVYRVLRSINPSPYLFYFDYGSYKIFGSSPEVQIAVKAGIAQINPIAGTYRRTGDDEQDAQRAKDLAADPKENAEHIMLVDLARNDLGRHSSAVNIKQLKEIQFYSHVIHLVSKVEGTLNNDTNAIEIFADTFPAGTLSGAPKYKAMQLIDKYESENRFFYGGAIGYIGLNGDMNQAIIIRSFLSKDNQLHCQAGAGIVAASNEESELQEVNNKLGALKKAIQEAENL